MLSRCCASFSDERQAYVFKLIINLIMEILRILLFQCFVRVSIYETQAARVKHEALIGRGRNTLFS